MLATFACLLAGGVCTFVYKEHFVAKLEANMIELMGRYPAPNAGGDIFAKDTWDSLQSEVSLIHAFIYSQNTPWHQYRCCGITTIRDWATYRPELGGFPESCQCENGSEGCSALGDKFFFNPGCFSKLQPHTIDLVDAQGGTALSVSGLQV